MPHESWLLWIGAGLIGLFIVAQFFRSPTQLMWRAVKGIALGCLFVFAVNWVGGYFNFHLPFNPATALTAGFLGLPGVIALVTLKLWMFPT